MGLILNIAGIAGAFIIFKLYSAYNAKKSEMQSEGKDTALMAVFQQITHDMFIPRDRFPSNLKDLSGSALGGQPHFFNEADCSQGRFLGWIRTNEDKGDIRKVEGGFYRARVTKDVKYFWFFPGMKEELTPCVFRPGIDAHTYGPGEMEGAPPEGMVILKRSLDGMKLAISQGERYRSLLLDEQHKNKIMADMLVAIKDKERLSGMSETSKEATDEYEKILRRTKRLHDAAAGRGSQDSSFGSPYGQEMFGGENELGELGGGAGSDNLWKFET